MVARAGLLTPKFLHRFAMSSKELDTPGIESCKIYLKQPESKETPPCCINIYLLLPKPDFFLHMRKGAVSA